MLEYRCKAARLLEGKTSGKNRVTHTVTHTLTYPKRADKNRGQSEQRGVTLPFANMKRDIFSAEVFDHGPAGLIHQLLSQTKTPVGALHRLSDRWRCTEVYEALEKPAKHLSATKRATHGWETFGDEWDSPGM